MDPIILGAGASFLAGAAGYVIARYWVIPIRSYGRAKSALARTLDRLEALCPESAGASTHLKSKPLQRQMKLVRQAASALLDCYQIDLPVWYRLKLRSAGQDPENAIPLLLELHQLPAPGQVVDRMARVRRQLQL